MIDLLPALYTHLTTDPKVNQFIGTRIFPHFIPQEEPLPALVWTVDGVNREPRNYNGLVEAFIDIEIRVDGLDYGTAQSIADELRKSIDSFQGDLEGFEVRGIFLDNQLERYVPPRDGTGSGTLVFIQEFRMWFRETLALAC